MRDLVRAMAAEGPHPSEETLKGVQGLCFASGDGVICAPARPLIKDLDALPFPARHLFDLARYPLYASNGERMVTLLSSRGCPYNCSYCFKGIVGRTYRQRSPDNVLTEIRDLIKTYGYRYFYFIDDLFTLDRRRLKTISEQIISEGLDIRWQCLARVDLISFESLKLMRKAGCREIHYGIESGNPEILASLDKGITMDQVRRAVTWTAEADILAKGYFMLGLPGDTEETMRQTISFANELPLDEAMFSLTTPFPGTRLWDELVARRPEIQFDQDFSQAYYYARYEGAVKPFLNVSEVSDERLSRLALEAQGSFQEAKRRHKYDRLFGPLLGRVLFKLSTISLVRKLGHGILSSRLFESVRGLKKLAHYDLREEYAEKWN